MKLFEIKNTSPKWQIFEAAEGKNVHLEHIEDEIYNLGYLGAQKALNYLEGLRRMFAQGEGEPTKVTVKWDGAPAIICGVDPADGEFFVGTKSVFAKTEPKLCKSERDINKFYGEQEGLAAKLKVALKSLSKLNIGGVLQGDLMFTPGDVETANIEGQDCYVFTPNTITYAVPVASELGNRIAAAKIGIIFHTAYEGASLPDMQASFGASVAGLTPSKDVWFDDATYKDFTGIASLTPEEDAQIKAVLLAAATTFRKITEADFNRIVFTGRKKISASGKEEETMTEFGTHIKPFINNLIRGGEQVGDPTTFLQNFMTYYRGKMEKDINDLMAGSDFTDEQSEAIIRYMGTTDAAQRKAMQPELQQLKIKTAIITRVDNIVEKEKFIADNSNTLLGILAIYKRIVEAKLLILQKMQKIESIGTFIKTDDGYKVTAPEGFVAIGHDGGAVKLVDRIEFSRQNFNATKSWKK